MKIKKEFKLDKCVAHNESRPQLNQVYFDGKRLIATDDHKLAVIIPDQNDIDKEEKHGYIPPEAFLESRKLKQNEHIEVTEKEVVIHKQKHKIIYDREKANTEYPKIDNIIDKKTFEKPMVKIALNPVYLLKLAEALGSRESIVLYISQEYRNTNAIATKAIGIQAFGVDLKERFGILMPIKMED